MSKIIVKPDWPTSFWITALSGAVYFLSVARRARSTA
jgi:hypothetical protein